MRRGIFAFWGVVFFLLAGLYAWRISQRESTIHGDAGIAFEEARPLEHFQLVERSGEDFDTSSLDGQVWVASFFFSSCSGACVRLNTAVADLNDELAEEPVTFVSISVDPENDTPERLREYASRFKADPDRWKFLTGEAQNIRDIIQGQFQLSAEQTTHSDRLVLINRNQRIVGMYHGTDPVQVMALKRRLHELLKEAS
jgi:cytochrome oxidase Cu insertion factor (SCO1/SenC/PrrC family)